MGWTSGQIVDFNHLCYGRKMGLLLTNLHVYNGLYGN